MGTNQFRPCLGPDKLHVTFKVFLALMGLVLLHSIAAASGMKVLDG